MYPILSARISDTDFCVWEELSPRRRGEDLVTELEYERRPGEPDAATLNRMVLDGLERMISWGDAYAGRLYRVELRESQTEQAIVIGVLNK